jgi:hypothetical protein
VAKKQQNLLCYSPKIYFGIQKPVDFRLKPAYNQYMNCKKETKQPVLHKSNIAKKEVANCLKSAYNRVIV